MKNSYQVAQTLSILQRHLCDSLIAVYLHGSGVSGGLKPASDIDILVVIDKEMTHDQRTLLVSDFMVISGLYPSDPQGRRPLEIAVFVSGELASLSYPAKCELMYGEWLRQSIEQGQLEGQVYDPEFTLMLAQAQQEAVSLWQSKEYQLPVVNEQQIKQAMLDSLPNLLSSLDSDERNVLLTLARMWKTMETGQFVTKDKAVDWVINRVPDELQPILIGAKMAYLNGIPIDWIKKKIEIQKLAKFMELGVMNSFK
ncbi:aminoglycoside adenylyltransferase family protein [Providencia hangzhouensis]